MERAMLASAKEHFERDGYVMFQNVLDNELMQEAKAHIAYLIANNPGVRPENLGHTLMKDDPF